MVTTCCLHNVEGHPEGHM